MISFYFPVIMVYVYAELLRKQGPIKLERERSRGK